MSRLFLNLLACAWLIAFCLCFYSMGPLPNNPHLSRAGIWSEFLAQLPGSAFALFFNDEKIPWGWIYFPQRLSVILVAAVILAGAWGVGHLLLRLVRAFDEQPGRERTVFAIGLGLSALSLLTLVLGKLALLSRPVFGAVIAAAVVAEWLLRRTVDRKDALSAASVPSAPRLTDHDHRRRWLRLGIVAAILPFLLTMFLGSMLPSTDFDVREYHLAGPKEFFLAGKVSMLEHNVYTSFPFGTEMLSLLAMVLFGDWEGGALAGQLVLMCFIPLTGLALYAAGRRWFGALAGWTAALVYLTAPWTFRIAIIAYTEGGLSFYLLAALLAAATGIEALSQQRPAGRAILLAGLFAGSAMACKYTGVVQVVIPLGLATVIAPFVVARKQKGCASSDPVRGAAKMGAVFTLGFLATMGPWLLKNLVETGNPVYPLMYTLFDGKDWDAMLNARFRAAHSPPDYDVAKIPFWAVDVTMRNDWLSPLFYGLAPLALLAATRRRLAAWLWVYVVFLFLSWWGLTHRLDRFWVPMLPVAALLAGAGAAATQGLAWSIVRPLCIVPVLVFNLVMVVSGFSGYNQFLIDVHFARRQTSALTTPEIAYLNDSLASLPPDVKVLCVGEAQVFDARFPLVYDTVFDRNTFEEWTAGPAGDSGAPRPMKSADEIRRILAAQGITHILVNWREIIRYRTSYGYTDYVTPARLAELLKMEIVDEPLSFAARERARLSDDDFQAEVARFQPQFQLLKDGRRVLVGGLRRTIPQATVDEVARWGPELIGAADGDRVFIGSQIYPVRREMRAADGQR